MRYFLICRFLHGRPEDNILSNRAYAYFIEKDLYYEKQPLPGKRYRIKNSYGYNYQNSIIEITSVLFCENDYLMAINKDTNEIVPLAKGEDSQNICLKKLISLEEVEEHEKNPYLLPLLEYLTSHGKKMDYVNECETPLLYDNQYFSCIEEVYKYTKSKTLKDEAIKSTENYIYVKKGEESMNKMFGNIRFGQLRDENIKMSFNGLAYRTSNNNYVVYDEKSNTLIDVSDLVFDMDNFLYLMPVAIKDIHPGDIIIHNDSYMIVTSIGDEAARIGVVDPEKGEDKLILPLRNLFGFNYYTKVVSLFNEKTFGEPTDDNPFGNMLPFILMSNNSNKTNNSSLKTFAIMSMMNNSSLNLQKNPLLLALMMNDNDVDNFLPFFCLGKNIFGADSCNCGCDVEK